MNISGTDREPEPQDREDIFDDEQHAVKVAISEQMVQLFFDARKKLPNGHPDQADYHFIGKLVATPAMWDDDDKVEQFNIIFRRRYVGPGKMFTGKINKEHWLASFIFATMILQTKMETVPIFKLAVQSEGYWFTYASLKAALAGYPSLYF